MYALDAFCKWIENGEGKGDKKAEESGTDSSDREIDNRPTIEVLTAISINALFLLLLIGLTAVNWGFAYIFFWWILFFIFAAIFAFSIQYLTPQVFLDIQAAFYYYSNRQITKSFSFQSQGTGKLCFLQHCIGLFLPHLGLLPLAFGKRCDDPYLCSLGSAAGKNGSRERFCFAWPILFRLHHSLSFAHARSFLSPLLPLYLFPSIK